MHMRRSAVRELLKIVNLPGMISFAGGIPAQELFPVKETAEAAAAILQRHGGAALQYGETEGLPELRDWIAERFSRPALQVRRENVMIVTGSQQALDLIGKVFLDPGDRVFVENPTYLAMISAWRPFKPAFVPVPSEVQGVEAIPHSPGERAKLIYLVPNFQNPQGTTMSLRHRRQLLEYARNLGALVIEDNPYGELRYRGEPVPDLLELDLASETNGKFETPVVHLGTFSKTLAPGLRVGWIVAPMEVVDKLVQAKQSADLHTSTFCQHVVFELVRNGVLDRQLPLLRAEYRRRRDTMMAALAAHLPDGTTWTRPEGGMFLLVRLPGIQARALLQRALAHKVAFVPGDDFHIDGAGHDTLRLNFSSSTPEKIEEGVKRLGLALAEFTAISP
ncbi:2-aminoadipate transaminase [Verrucomicrobia bacterium]|nr:2-aminoadipate transaminase [Verrucomicrobiota bacterium]